MPLSRSDPASLRLAPPMSETVLWERLRRHGCRASGDELVRRYLPLAFRLASDHVRSSSPRHDDARSAALLGLVKAVQRFEPARGNSFAVYARAVIRGEVLRHLRSTRYAIHVPRPLHERWMQVRAARRAAVVELGHEPSDQELAEWLGWDVELVVEAQAVIRAETPGELDTGADDRDPSNLDDRTLRHVAVSAAVAQLEPRLQQVLVRRFRDEASQATIAAELGLSQAHVSRLLARALALVRARLGEEGDVLLAG